MGKISIEQLQRFVPLATRMSSTEFADLIRTLEARIPVPGSVEKLIQMTRKLAAGIKDPALASHAFWEIAQVTGNVSDLENVLIQAKKAGKDSSTTTPSMEAALAMIRNGFVVLDRARELDDTMSLDNQVEILLAIAEKTGTAEDIFAAKEKITKAKTDWPKNGVRMKEQLFRLACLTKLEVDFDAAATTTMEYFFAPSDTNLLLRIVAVNPEKYLPLFRTEIASYDQLSDEHKWKGSYKPKLLVALAKITNDANDIAAARHAALEITASDKEWKHVDLLIAIAKLTGEKSDFETAYKTALEIKFPRYRGYAFRDLADVTNDPFYLALARDLIPPEKDEDGPGVDEQLIIRSYYAIGLYRITHDPSDLREARETAQKVSAERQTSKIELLMDIVRAIQSMPQNDGDSD